MSRNTTVAVSVVLLLAVGAASVLTMPASAESARRAQARIDSVPLRLPPWIGQDVPESDRLTKYMRIAEADAHLNRLYAHEKTGQVIAVSLLYGNQGAMCAHDPDTCYAGSGYAPAGRATRGEFNALGKLWRGRYSKPEPTPELLEVCWGFTADGVWSAPDAPRREFAAYGMLYKLYAQTLVPAEARSRESSDTLTGFLSEFLPKLRVALTAE